MAEHEKKKRSWSVRGRTIRPGQGRIEFRRGNPWETLAALMTIENFYESKGRNLSCQKEKGKEKKSATRPYVNDETE